MSIRKFLIVFCIVATVLLIINAFLGIVFYSPFLSFREIQCTELEAYWYGFVSLGLAVVVPITTYLYLKFDDIQYD